MNRKQYRLAIVVSPWVETLLIGLLAKFIAGCFEAHHIGEPIDFDWSVYLFLLVCCLCIQVFSWTHLWAFTNHGVDERTEGTWEALEFVAVMWAGIVSTPLLFGIVIADAIVMIAHTNPRVTVALTYLLSLILCIGFYCARGRKLMKKENGNGKSE